MPNPAWTLPSFSRTSDDLRARCLPRAGQRAPLRLAAFLFLELDERVLDLSHGDADIGAATNVLRVNRCAAGVRPKTRGRPAASTDPMLAFRAPTACHFLRWRSGG